MALDALLGDKTVQEIGAKHQLHPNQVSTWKRYAIDDMADVFASGGGLAGPTESEVKDLRAKIGRLAVENDFGRRVQVMSPDKKQPASTLQTASDIHSIGFTYIC